MNPQSLKQIKPTLFAVRNQGYDLHKGRPMANTQTEEERQAISAHIDEGYLQAERGELG